MRFMYNGEEWTITFHHTRYDSFERRKRNRAGSTVCVVSTGKYGVSGRAECSLADQFSKSTGRLLSLGRATSLMPPEFRVEAVVAYTSRYVQQPLVPKAIKTEHDCECSCCRAYEAHHERMQRGSDLRQ